LGPNQIATDPSACLTSLPDVSCCDPSCETGWIGPHCRFTAPPGLVRWTIGPGLPPLPWMGTFAPGDSGCCQVFETWNEYVVALVFGSVCCVGFVAT
jgi:hypothetical protein